MNVNTYRRATGETMVEISIWPGDGIKCLTEAEARELQGRLVAVLQDTSIKPELEQMALNNPIVFSCLKAIVRGQMFREEALEWAVIELAKLVQHYQAMVEHYMANAPAPMWYTDREAE